MEHEISPTVITRRDAKVKLFPLHLTSFEHYMLVDDRPKYPMTFTVQLELSGQLNRQVFTDAINDALSRHPLLTAVIGPGKQGKDCWIAATNSDPHIDWGTVNEPIEFPNGEYIDIRSEVGLRIFIRSDENQAVVTAQFHHATCDGIGSYQFLGDVLYQYAVRMGSKNLAALNPLDPKRLRDRGKASYDVSNFLLPDGSYQRTWDEALTHLMRSNIVLKSGNRKPSGFRRPYPGIQSYTFDKAEYKQLRLAAQSQGQIINDLLLEKLFEALLHWNRKQRILPVRKHACVMMPLNLRETSDNDISACNIVAHAFVRRTAKSLQDKNRFRHELANELLQVKHSRHKIKFMHMLAGGHYFYPRMLKASLEFKRSLATAILSNTGDPTRQFYSQLPRDGGLVRCGNLALEDISGVPPLRPGTNATVSIFTYRRELKICLRCDPNQFSEQDTRALLEGYVDAMRAEIQTG